MPDPDVPGTRPPADAAAMPQVFWDTASDLLIVADRSGVLVATNPQWRTTLGWTVAQHPGLTVLDLVHDDDRAATRETLGALAPGRRFGDLRLRMRTLGGEHRSMSCSGVTDGRYWYISGRDVTEQRRKADDARAEAAVFEQSEIVIVSVDAEHRITRWSAGAEALYGWTAREALGQNVIDLIDPRPLTVVEGHGAVMEGRYQSRHKDGELRYAQVRYIDLLDDEGRYAGSISVGTDVSAQMAAETEGRVARHHLQAVTESMAEGLFALDPDGGVVVMNQAAETMLGWSLDEVRGQSLHEVTRHRHALGLRDEPGPDPAYVPIGVKGLPLPGVDIGGVLRVDDEVFTCRDGRTLPVSYTVTPLGPAGRDDGWVVVFRETSESRAEQERRTEELRALVWAQRVDSDMEGGRLELHAQPIVDLRTMAVAQDELLLRIIQPDGTVSPPKEYLAAAEAYGLIGRIDRWVLARAIDLAAAGRWVDVNVSATSIADSSLVPDFERRLIDSGADPSLLVIEITETAVISDMEAGRRFVDEIRALGCRVALDDFGAGYSGFAYLKQLPVDYVKIDIAFVRDLTVSPASRHVVEAVVTMARGMGLKTVAEGVETAETLELLAVLGVDYVQGHHLGRPAPL